MAETLRQRLEARSQPGELYKTLPDGRIECFACAHRCPISEGYDGVCKVRGVRNGQLWVPKGYVAGLQIDPIEKKPFYHVLPGNDALSFGMLGCDLHCDYCLLGNTQVLTNHGFRKLEHIFENYAETSKAIDGVAPLKNALEVIAHTGKPRRVERVSKTKYSGSILHIQPACLRPIKATPKHPFLSVKQLNNGHFSIPQWTYAEELTAENWLIVPKLESTTVSPLSIDVAPTIQDQLKPFKVHHKHGPEILRQIIELGNAGLTSKEIGKKIGIEASHIRHLRSRINRGDWNLDSLEQRICRLVFEKDRVRIPKERRPGIPAQLTLDVPLARLFGLYCAEGNVRRLKNRPNSATTNFSYGKHEHLLQSETESLLAEYFGVTPSRVERHTTLAITTGKSSIGLLLKGLFGKDSRTKRIPECLLHSPKSVIESFLDGYVAGDGFIDKNGQITVTTVSETLAAGVAALLLRVGKLPQWYRYSQPERRKIQGREIRQSPYCYMVRWSKHRNCTSNVVEEEQRFLVPIRKIQKEPFSGSVYNLEVEEDHSYLAHGIATHNCQNWVSSQALRDKDALASPRDVSAQRLVQAAEQGQAPVLVSTYNEPLITAEWAKEVFEGAVAEGFLCGFVSNGNATPEVLDYLRPYVSLYKVDLKSFDDAQYRRLGAPLAHILKGIELIFERKFWLEIVTLIVPGLNDDEAQLRGMARFLAQLSPDIPWHLTGYRPMYQSNEVPTPASSLLRAAEIGLEEGLRYVYCGNRPGQVGEFENTRCFDCGATLIERRSFRILKNHMSPDGACPRCKKVPPGIWTHPRAKPRDPGSSARPHSLFV